MPGGVLVLAGCAWNAFWVCLRVSGVRLRGVLGPSWRVLGGSWKGFSESWRLPGSFLAIFLKFFGHLEQYTKIAKNLRKNNGFSLIFQFREGPGLAKFFKNRRKIVKRG